MTFCCKVILLGLAPASAFACTCSFGPAAPKNSWARSEKVFVGHVESVRDLPHSQVVRVRVIEAFLGSQVGDIFEVEEFGMLCMPVHHSGMRAVFHLQRQRFTKSKFAWTMVECAAPTELEESPDDLLFLHTLPKSAERNRFSVIVERDRRLASGAGVRLQLRSKSTILRTTTDAQGLAVWSAIPPGTYHLHADPGEGWKLGLMMSRVNDGPRRRPDNEFVVGADTAIAVRVHLALDNWLKGRLIAPDGSAIRGATVDLATVDGRKLSNRNTGADGSFAFRTLFPGLYRLTAGRVVLAASVGVRRSTHRELVFTALRDAVLRP